ncbi:unnamed protein product [Psylliodes chrysocephalus]|uniref:Phospholipase A2 n=1 Tax=Psylliodes chrysocephalus TaxID=3402493 RepID=A0A9P0D9G3_9CUCU|nr:unnamed protein product [Psylliodes chrysocephala]
MKIQALLKCILLFVILHETRSSTVYISDYGMAKMIELSTKSPYCYVQTDRGKIRDRLLSSDPRRVRKMSDESVDNLAKVCNKDIHSPHQGGFIYPGTKWCGPGNKAKNYTDLGYHYKEDTCCREHDRCPKSLGKGECRKGICNHSLFTRSHCDCDANFRKCLQTANTETANTIGAIFFNIVQVICFKERTPCTQWQSYYSNNLIPFSGRPGECPYYFENSDRYVETVTQKMKATSYVLESILDHLKNMSL